MPKMILTYPDGTIQTKMYRPSWYRLHGTKYQSMRPIRMVAEGNICSEFLYKFAKLAMKPHSDYLILWHKPVATYQTNWVELPWSDPHMESIY